MVPTARSLFPVLLAACCLIYRSYSFVRQHHSVSTASAASNSNCLRRQRPSLPFSAPPSSTRTTTTAAKTVVMAAIGSAEATTSTAPSWSALQKNAGETDAGRALNDEVALRKRGRGSAFVQNTLRLFDSDDEKDLKITLYRDHAGWCPYCQKLMLMVEEKRIPMRISLVPMRSYGDKPKEFLQKVPSGLLPAIEVGGGSGRVITESQVIMELLDEWYSPEDGYRPMLPGTERGMARYDKLSKLERE